MSKRTRDKETNLFDKPIPDFFVTGEVGTLSAPETTNKEMLSRRTDLAGVMLIQAMVNFNLAVAALRDAVDLAYSSEVMVAKEDPLMVIGEALVCGIEDLLREPYDGIR